METCDGSFVKRYENRELSWIKFNLRVLNESKDSGLPIFERLKFMSIASSNLDEFFMVRVAKLKSKEFLGKTKRDIAGFAPEEQLQEIEKVVREFVQAEYELFDRELLPELKRSDFKFCYPFKEASEDVKSLCEPFINDHVKQGIMYEVYDISNATQRFENKKIYLAVKIRNKINEDITIKFFVMPESAQRLMPISTDSGVYYALWEDILFSQLESLFTNCEIIETAAFRVTRNADFKLDEEKTSLVNELSEKLSLRDSGFTVRLEYQSLSGEDKDILDTLKAWLNITDSDIYKTNGPLDFTFLMKIYGITGYEELKTNKYKLLTYDCFHGRSDIFGYIKQKDILLHHPYQSFEPVVSFIEAASLDPKVESISMTLYRVSKNSPVISGLINAAGNGKRVFVLMEIKARFDEEANIKWAEQLKAAGCNVIYGVKGLKTHSKITLVQRKEESGIINYVHLGTGNYNDSTSKMYTDCGLITANKEIGEDAVSFFNMMSGENLPAHWNRLIVSPYWMRKKFLSLIKCEIQNANEGREAYIIAKMNSLCDKEMIDALYEASNAGVKVRLIIRGICSLRAGIEGMSKNIEVRSIVGNFLEHSRIFAFCNGGKTKVYMGSADWMTRNLDRRVEVVFPILDDDLKERVIDILNLQLKDNVKASIMSETGVYLKTEVQDEDEIDSQLILCQES